MQRLKRFYSSIATLHRFLLPELALLALVCLGCGSIIDPLVATPVFSLPSGNYATAQLVSISDATAGAVIYFTTNGTTPTTSSTPYTGAISVSHNQTMEAIAVDPGIHSSTVATATYTFGATTAAATPSITPPGGSYASAQSVTITDATPGASIYFTTTGATPTTSSTPYTGAIAVSSNQTIQAIAVASGFTVSAVASATYTVGLPVAATPVIGPAAGSYASAQSVTITDATPGASIYFTTTGATPTTGSTPYTGAIAVAANETIKAIAVATGYSTSPVASATYTITLPAAATPVITPPGGSYASAQSVTITDATPGASIYFTTNGATPTTSSTPYTGAIAVSSNETIQAIAVASGYTNSAVASAAYTITLPAAATPVIGPAGGSYPSAQSVTITDTTPGASIYFTTNGATPTASSTPYTGAIPVSSNETIQAIAVASGYTNSAVASASYTITLPPAATPVIAPPAGTYPTAQSVTITDTTPGASIYFTINGTTPTTSSTPYTGAINVSVSETIEAIAVASGYTNSAVATAAYTIMPVVSGNGTWTWMGGSNTVNAAGVYGTLGVAAPTNIPGARSDAVEWVDKNGNFWLFGGQNYNFNGSSPPPPNYFNDLWEFNITTKQWTWVSGSSGFNATGVYGSVGVSSPGSTPGARLGSSAWTDANGNLWLFGGSGFDSSGNDWLLNDLWKFDPTRTQWTWMGGSNMTAAPGVYGTKGTPAPGNIPGERVAAAAWTDHGGNLWLFGGQTDFTATVSASNDLWTFSPSSNEWTWVSGSNTPDALGVYGTLGTPSPANVPGGRFTQASWIDGSGNLWLFGGEGYATNGTPFFLNDLWKYNLSSGNWTWVSGSSTTGAYGVYGTQGTPAPGNTPGSREWHAGWNGNIGKFWIFGGQAEDQASSKLALLNDLWVFDPSTTQWTWASGSNTSNAGGVYGTLGTPAATNVPGARRSPATWVDPSGNLWMFGGYGIDSNGATNDLNDLWRYQP